MVRELVMGLKISDLARAAGTTAPAIRYYEEIGLLPHPRRVGCQRRYGEDDVRRLTFVRRCRDFGFSIEQIRTLATLNQDNDRSCKEARDIAEAHLGAVREKLLDLRALEHRIAGLIETSDTFCRGGSGADCVVLEDLSKPAEPYPS